MKDYKKQNIEDALQTIAKLELLLKMLDINDRSLDLIQDKLWKSWKNQN